MPHSGAVRCTVLISTQSVVFYTQPVRIAGARNSRGVSSAIALKSEG